MPKRWLALGSFVASSLWVYFWEWIRSQLYDRAQHMLAPYFQWLTLNELGRYGPPAIFVAVGLYLFWLTRPQKVHGTASESAVRAARPAEPQPIKPADIEEVTAFYNAWLLPAAQQINQIITFVNNQIYRNKNPAVASHAGLIQKSIIDEERRDFARLINNLDGTYPTDDEGLQITLGQYYRSYQSCRTWIAQGAKLAALDLRRHVAFIAWLHVDAEFLRELRRLSGPERFDCLRREITAAGYNEGITQELNLLTKD